MSSFQSKLTKLVLAEVEAAILKAATPAEGVAMPDFATPAEARDHFRDLVMADLNERLGAAQKTPKPKGKGKGKGKAEPVVEPVVEPAPPVPEVVVPVADSPKEKKKRGPMTEEAKAAMKAKRDATLANKAAGGGSPPAKAKKAKPAEDANLAKVDPTWRKHLKTAAKAQGKEVNKEMEAALLSHLNGLTKEEFNAKKAEEHVSTFLAEPTGSNAAAALAKVPTDLEIVEFKGKDYYVNPETKRVYEGEGEQDAETGGWTNYKPVGYVGMAAFSEMTLE